MVNTNNNITLKINKPYKYGFKPKIIYEIFPRGLNEKIILSICKKKEESLYFKNFRLYAYKNWYKKIFPKWANIYTDTNKINLNYISCYSTPKKKIKNIKNIDPELLKTFDKLGILLLTKKNSKNIAVDAIFDSISIATTYQEKLSKLGIIFCSISEAMKKYPKLIKKYLGKIIPIEDNYFASLNSAVFSDGSFCYIPQNVCSPLELSSYFRINNKNSGQFERTLIVAEKNSSLNYLEGCTAIEYNKNQLHAAVVEIIALDNAYVNYSTIQNWYSGNTTGIGGIFNFVTKRALCIGKNSKVSWTQIEFGSSITWKYPSCILIGEASIGEFYSIALTKNYQEADTGTKMIHIGEKTTSKIISKGISCDYSKNSYRGLVKISSTANSSRNFSQCDSFILGSNSLASTYPYIDISNSRSTIEHEAKISKISEEQLFYLTQRGIKTELAIGLLVNGFCKDVLTMLPLEFAFEIQKLLNLKLH
jgi:Fe-S cluster assembly protein SufB